MANKKTSISDGIAAIIVMPILLLIVGVLIYLAFDAVMYFVF